jgi:hypothetical protein
MILCTGFCDDEHWSECSCQPLILSLLGKPILRVGAGWRNDAFIRIFAFALHSNQLEGILSRILSDLLFFPLHQIDGQSYQWGSCYLLFI